MRVISATIGGIGTIGILLWVALTEIPHLKALNPYYPFIFVAVCMVGIIVTIIWMVMYGSPRVDNKDTKENDK